MSAAGATPLPLRGPPIQVCLFDMDGVIRHWTEAADGRAEDAAGLPRGSLMAVASTVPEYERGVLGLATYEQWCQATEIALAARFGSDPAACAVREWRMHRGDVDPEMTALVRQVRQRVPVGLLSNAHDCLPDDLEVLGLADAFDSVICSATVHLAKPDPAIYCHAAEVFGVEPDACLFTDDLDANVRGARSAGMMAHHFTGIDELRRALAGAGVLTPAASP